MKIIFSKSNRIGALLIRWGTSDGFFKLAPFSHVGICFDDILFFESNGSGVDVNFYGRWKKAAGFKFIADISLEQQEEVYQEILKEYRFRKYDYKAVLYLAWVHLKRKFFGSKIPKVNAWGVDNAFYCVEIINALKVLKGLHKIETLHQTQDIEMIDPFELYKQLKRHEKHLLEF